MRPSLGLLAIGLLALPARPLPGQRGSLPVRVVNPGNDLPLSIRLREVFRVGAEESGVTFARLFPWTVTADRHGRLFVLDLADRRVVVLDSNGVLLGYRGRPGGGPGEFVRPQAIGVGPHQELLVADAGKQAVVRFDAVGQILPQVPVQRSPVGVGSVGPLLVVAHGPVPFEADRLVLGDDLDGSPVAEPPAKLVRFKSCPVALEFRPILAPPLQWTSASGPLAYAMEATYSVHLLTAPDRRVQVSRTAPPIRVLRRDALNRVPEGFTIQWGGKACRIPPKEMVDVLGFARARSPVEGLALSPDSVLWVARRASQEGPLLLDLFGPDGRYRGTVPEGTPLPVAFLSPRRFVVLKADPDGVPLIVGYEYALGAR